MKFDRSDTLLTDAFAVIAHYDPALYARMSADTEWRVATDYDAAFPPASQRDGYAGLMDYMMAIDAYGATVSEKLARDGIPGTFISPEPNERWSRDNGVPLAAWVADVLVHEYTHAHETTRPGIDAEPPAFRNGATFARKLPRRYGEAMIREARESFAHGDGYA